MQVMVNGSKGYTLSAIWGSLIIFSLFTVVELAHSAS